MNLALVELELSFVSQIERFNRMNVIRRVDAGVC